MKSRPYLICRYSGGKSWSWRAPSAAPSGTRPARIVLPWTVRRSRECPRAPRSARGSVWSSFRLESRRFRQLYLTLRRGRGWKLSRTERIWIGLESFSFLYTVVRFMEDKYHIKYQFCNFIQIVIISY